MHKAGFVNIIGNPNVGKSTLMNAFVGEQLSIITSKAQTTRICDMLSKSDQTVAHDAWIKIIEEMSDKFREAGARRQTVSQIWNRKGTFKLGFMWEYKDEKAFIACQSLFREAEIEFQKRTGITWKITPNRGVVLTDMHF